MGLIISANGIIQSSAPRNVVSQITADVLALMDARYFTVDHAIGSNINQVKVHGNDQDIYRFLRASTNTNNPNPPTLANDLSLRFAGANSLRTNTYDDLNTEVSFGFVLKLDSNSPSGVIFRCGDAASASTSKTLIYNHQDKTIAIRQNVTAIAKDIIPLDRYIPIILSCSTQKTRLLVNNSIIEGDPVALTNKFYQLMSGDASPQPTGNLKYFSFYKGAATNDEMFKLQQILKQNFNL